MGVDALTSVTLTASATGFTDGTQAMTVLPCRDDFSMSLSTPNVRSGQALRCTLTLTGLAGPSGHVMTVATTDGATAPA
ncbi:hypothetical protein ABTK87_19220, partial [Acinetobacter baumannii]